MRTIVFDVESTGLPTHAAPLDKQPRIIELGALAYDSGIESRYSQLIHPQCAISAEITKITGITDEAVQFCPVFKEAWEGIESVQSFKDFIAECEVLIAHNAEFDVKMLSFELERLGLNPKDFIPPTVICTVAEFYHVFGRRPRLIELHQKILGQPLAQKHRALDDVEALYRVCLKAGLMQ